MTDNQVNFNELSSVTVWSDYQHTVYGVSVNINANMEASIDGVLFKLNVTLGFITIPDKSRINRIQIIFI